MAFKLNEYNILKLNQSHDAINRVSHKKSYRSLFFILWVLVGGGILKILFLPWQQTITGTGKVIAYSPNERSQEINATLDGKISFWHVMEGSKIKKGELIVELEDNDPELLGRLELEVKAIKKRLDATKHAIETAKKNVNRQQTLFEKGLSSPLGIEQAKLNLNKYLVDEANTLAELTRVETKLARQKTQKIYAPIDGTILKILAAQGGQLIKQGETLAILVPDTNSRAVELLVDGRDMPLISTGRQVRLQFEGWPAIQFSGWPSVAVGTFAGKVALIDPSDDGEGQFRIIIFPTDKEPWPEASYLRQGVRARGWVLLERVTIGFELWRIFNDFPPSIKKNKETKQK